MLIRLIDVVLILLFGFISISTIERQSLVRLPDSETSAPVPASRGDVVSVTVLHDSTTALADGPRRYLVGLARGAETLVVGARALRAELARVAERSTALQARAGRDIVDPRIELRVDRDDRIASLFTAHEIAEQLGLVARLVVRAEALEADAAERSFQ